MSAARRTNAWRDRQRATNSPAYQRELAAGRARKERYRGVCEICGKPTNGSDGPGKAPTLCVAHRNALIGLVLRGQGPRQQQALALLADGPKRYMDFVREMGFPRRTDAGQLLHRLRQHGLVERVGHGLYCATTTATQSSPKDAA